MDFSTVPNTWLWWTHVSQYPLISLEFWILTAFGEFMTETIFCFPDSKFWHLFISGTIWIPLKIEIIPPNEFVCVVCCCNATQHNLIWLVYVFIGIYSPQSPLHEEAQGPIGIRTLPFSSKNLILSVWIRSHFFWMQLHFDPCGSPWSSISPLAPLYS